MIKTANFDFVDNNIQVAFKFGEFTLARLNYSGFKRATDIFNNPVISSPNPPIEDLKNTGHQIAYLSSYPVAKKLNSLSFKKRYICYTARHYKHYYIDCSSGFENYCESFKSKTISTIRRKVKKVAASCSNEEYFKIYRTPAEIEEFIGIADSISKKTFQFKLLNQGLQCSQKYVEDYIQKANDEKIIGFILFVNDQPVAYNLCPIYGDGVLLYFYTGYDPEYSDYSPGTVLQYKTIETAFKLDYIKKYDLCTGEGKHKELFSDEFIHCADIYYFPLTLKNFFNISFKVVYDKALDAIKFVIRKIINVDRVKKWIRLNIKLTKQQIVIYLTGYQLIEDDILFDNLVCFTQSLI
jgi:hypothetical protein